jgi:glycosyltransferase involved in cell wall biosynthesis
MNRQLTEAYRKAFETKRLTFIVETEAVRDAWEPFAGNQVVHIPAAIPSNEYKPTPSREARQRLGLPGNALICLFFGTHREGKDYAIAIKAAKLSKSKPYLLFVGPLISGNDPAKLLQENSYDYGASWEGYYPDEKVGELFDACDVVMLPYTEGYDKGSAVLLQACQYLKSVIATDTGHLVDFVTTHQTGLLFDPGNAQSLADCYDRLLSSRLADMDVMTESLLATREFYSWKNLLRSYLKIFELEHSANRTS